VCTTFRPRSADRDGTHCKSVRFSQFIYCLKPRRHQFVRTSVKGFLESFHETRPLSRD